MRQLSLAVVMLIAADPLAAQTKPPIRDIGRLERISRDSLSSVSGVLALSDGTVLVNDARGRQLLLFDSTLAHPRVVLDTTAATSNGYGRGAGGSLFRFRGDTALFLDHNALTMYVISPKGTVARIMSFPPPPGSRGGMAVFGRGGVPFIDPPGRLLHFNGGGGQGVTTLRVGTLITPEFLRERQREDSGRVIRVDLATRRVDTVAWLKTISSKKIFRTDNDGRLVSIENIYEPLSLVDEWTMLPDGTIAVLRARDYHIDWLDPSGRWTSTPKMHFDWQRVTDERKRVLIDSTVAIWQQRLSPNGRGRGGAPAPGVPPAAPNIALPVRPSDVPDYYPPFEWGIRAMQSDADGNVWIRTTTIVNGRPVYDVVNRKGEVFDRVQLPAFRAITGFGRGVVYMAVVDNSNVVRLERARVK